MPNIIEKISQSPVYIADHDKLKKALQKIKLYEIGTYFFAKFSDTYSYRANAGNNFSFVGDFSAYQNDVALIFISGKQAPTFLNRYAGNSWRETATNVVGKIVMGAIKQDFSNPNPLGKKIYGSIQINESRWMIILPIENN